MSQAIGHIIFGVRLDYAIRDAVSEHACALEIDASDLESFGFTEVYSGNADQPIGYCGIKLGQISEGNDVKISELFSMKPSDLQFAAALQNIHDLPQSIKAVCPDPEIWILWGSS